MGDQFEHSVVILGYHIYKDIFTSTIGRTLQSRRETANDDDDFAVAITEDDTVVGHVPRTISAVPCDMFLQKGGTISCTITPSSEFERCGAGSLVSWCLVAPLKMISGKRCKDYC